MAFVLLNPSTADESRDDPTIRRCIGFAQSEGFSGLAIVNLYAYRATKPVDLRRAGYPVGPDNDAHIAAAMASSPKVVLAWGGQARGMERQAAIFRLLREAHRLPYCLRVTSSGLPEHPLRLPSDCRFQRYFFGG